MNPKILVIDENPLTAENIRSRLSAFAEVLVAKDAASLERFKGESLGAVVMEWSLGALEGPDLLPWVAPFKCPIFLYTRRTDVVEGGAWSKLGITKAFTHLQRAGLVISVEESVARPASPGSGSPNFLLVEDSPTVRQFVKSVLLQAFPGAETIEADDGRKALAAMKSSHISLIVTDLQMPGMDGMSFIQLLHNNTILRKKPVIVLSAAVSDETRASLAALPKVQVLTKPASPESLVAAVTQLLEMP